MILKNNLQIWTPIEKKFLALPVQEIVYKGAIRNDTYSEWHVCLKQLCEKYLFAPMYLIIVLLPLLSHKVAMVFLESFHKSRKHLGVGCLISGLSRRAGTFHYKYCTRAIISRGLYIFYLIFKDHFFVFKEVFFRKLYTYVWLVFKSGL